MLLPQPLPLSDPTTSDAATLGYARRLLTYLGPAYPAPDGSVTASDYLAWGHSLATVRGTLLRALDQAFPNSATDLLSELETDYGLPTDPSGVVASRQGRLLATVQSKQAGDPTTIATALTTLLGYPTGVAVVDYTAAQVLSAEPLGAASAYAATTRRGVFVFAVVVPTKYLTDTSAMANINALVTRAKPAHTTFTVTDSAGPFLADDPSGVGHPGSLTDRTIIGA